MLMEPDYQVKRSARGMNLPRKTARWRYRKDKENTPCGLSATADGAKIFVTCWLFRTRWCRENQR
ncbi:hypothetical protein KCP76_20135 [Salmonella enterica subsp. enterica serovar Weltevreden]|nr:hypothetical protein KCP76_20135 [Salmonella enterica subsp. enterica serovar Weltevreden]